MNRSDTHRSPMADLEQTYPTPNGLPTRLDKRVTLTNERTNELTNDYQDQGSKSQVPNAPTPVENGDLALGCVCGRCDPACKYRPLYSCCGACMADTPWGKDSPSPAEEWARLGPLVAARGCEHAEPKTIERKVG